MWTGINFSCTAPTFPTVRTKAATTAAQRSSSRRLWHANIRRIQSKMESVLAFDYSIGRCRAVAAAAFTKPPPGRCSRGKNLLASVHQIPIDFIHFPSCWTLRPRGSKSYAENWHGGVVCAARTHTHRHTLTLASFELYGCCSRYNRNLTRSSTAQQTSSTNSAMQLI